MPANQVRLIGGRHRGRRLQFVPVPGLRPTPDRVRETLFNWLQLDLAGARCLDLFAGSGALGLEALSRGAGELVAVEQNPAAARRLRDNIAMLAEGERAEVVHGDAMRWLRRSPPRPFDVVFLDPPFASKMLAQACVALESDLWLSPAALIYVEQDAKHPWPRLPDTWALHREGSAGQTSQRLLRRSKGG